MNSDYLFKKIEDKVKWPSKKKYNCKRNKGEHEYLKPTILFEPSVRYNYNTDRGRGGMNSSQLHPEYKYVSTEIKIVLETRCKHCGKKVVSFLQDIIK